MMLIFKMLTMVVMMMLIFKMLTTVVVMMTLIFKMLTMVVVMMTLILKYDQNAATATSINSDLQTDSDDRDVNDHHFTCLVLLAAFTAL